MNQHPRFGDKLRGVNLEAIVHTFYLRLGAGMGHPPVIFVDKWCGDVGPNHKLFEIIFLF
jgi:hypothetical protein